MCQDTIIVVSQYFSIIKSNFKKFKETFNLRSQLLKILGSYGITCMDAQLLIPKKYWN